jgi:hypothetical protein
MDPVSEDLAIKTLKETADSTAPPACQPVIELLQAPVRPTMHTLRPGREAVLAGAKLVDGLYELLPVANVVGARLLAEERSTKWPLTGREV